MMEIERRKLKLQPPPPTRAWNDQIHKAYLFQELISNSDFNQTNLLITKDWRLWLIDFTRAFREYRKLDQSRSLRQDRPASLRSSRTARRDESASGDERPADEQTGPRDPRSSRPDAGLLRDEGG